MRRLLLMVNYKEASGVITNEITSTLTSVNSNEIDHLIDQINKAEKVFFVGVGRVLLSLQSIAKRFAHLGVQTYVVGRNNRTCYDG